MEVLGFEPRSSCCRPVFRTSQLLWLSFRRPSKGRIAPSAFTRRQRFPPWAKCPCWVSNPRTSVSALVWYLWGTFPEGGDGSHASGPAWTSFPTGRRQGERGCRHSTPPTDARSGDRRLPDTLPFGNAPVARLPAYAHAGPELDGGCGAWCEILFIHFLFSLFYLV